MKLLEFGMGFLFAINSYMIFKLCVDLLLD
jgi:hypothetical protein